MPHVLLPQARKKNPTQIKQLSLTSEKSKFRRKGSIPSLVTANSQYHLWLMLQKQRSKPRNSARHFEQDHVFCLLKPFESTRLTISSTSFITMATSNHGSCKNSTQHFEVQLSTSFTTLAPSSKAEHPFISGSFKVLNLILLLQMFCPVVRLKPGQVRTYFTRPYKILPHHPNDASTTIFKES